MADVNDTDQTPLDYGAEIAKRTERAGKTRWIRFTLAVLSGIPWVGSFLTAFSNLASEQGQSELTALQRAWLDAHADKIKQLEAAMGKIVEVAEGAGPADSRLDDDDFLSLVRQGFRIWDNATSDEKRDQVRRTLANASVSKLVSDDLVRLFLSWIETYDEVHFRIIGLLHRQSGLTRAALWRGLDGEQVREDSGDADLFKMIIRDLSTGSVIRQHRDTTYGGEFLKKPRQRGGGSSSTMKSAFDNIEGYELTQLGHLFVGYALDEPSTALPESSTQPGEN